MRGEAHLLSVSCLPLEEGCQTFRAPHEPELYTVAGLRQAAAVVVRVNAVIACFLLPICIPKGAPYPGFQWWVLPANS